MRKSEKRDEANLGLHASKISGMEIIRHTDIHKDRVYPTINEFDET
jgi:hypothetical protein